MFANNARIAKRKWQEDLTNSLKKYQSIMMVGILKKL